MEEWHHIIFFISFVDVNNVYISMNAIKIREHKNKSTNVC